MSRFSRLAAACACAALIVGCRGATPAAPPSQPEPISTVAERYVRLALALSLHDPASLEVYTGGAERTFDVANSRPSLADIAIEAGRLYHALGAPAAAGDPEPARRAYLAGELRAIAARARQRGGQRWTFDDEAREVYGIEPGRFDVASATAARNAIARELAEVAGLPPPDDAAARYAAFRARFSVPMNQVAPLFSRALAQARTDTRTHLTLPDDEATRVETTWGRAWPGFTWYEGRSRSLVQLAIDHRFDVAEIVQLACHEGYPGHHAQNVLRDRALVGERQLVEYTVVPRIGPFVPLAEAAADAGCDLLWPIERKVALAATLLPRASRSDLARLFRLDALAARLRPLVVEIARQVADGRMSSDEATERLTEDALVPAPDLFLKNLATAGASLAAYAEPMALAAGDEGWAALGEMWTRPLERR